MSKILVVDDEDQIVTVIKEILSAGDWDVITASSGQEGLTQFNLTPGIEVVLTDVLCGKMTSYDGIFLARSICKMHKGIPIIFMSGNLGPYGNEDLNEWSDYFIPKPFGFKELQAILTEVCDDYGIKVAKQAS